MNLKKKKINYQILYLNSNIEIHKFNILVEVIYQLYYLNSNIEIHKSTDELEEIIENTKFKF